ncbi:MAG TPA: hypothetical protein PKN95_14280 [Verrucomicrobiota bacterium]|nr:hypothetical protein [Verrucomicrobiota bacterium]HNT14669.1 hypothetical protein [Verrucomicrobiota bacterium]
MSVPQEQEDFTKLQQLLKLKRYEQPHPRYFNELSNQVIARLHAEARRPALDAAVSRAPWLRQLWRIIEGRPALAGVVTAGVCGLVLLGGFFMAGTGDRPDLRLDTGGVAGLAQHQETAPMLATSAAAVAPIFVTSSNPAASSPAAGSLFSIPLGPGLQPPQPASFQVKP